MQGFHSLTEVKKAISQGDITLPGLVNHYLKNIDERKSLNAFLEVYAEEALQQASLVQGKIQSGTAGRLDL